jgi:pantoate--beta-alanine ligase
VATVVLKLFNIVQPDVGYFGQKDAQQVRIIEQLVQDLNVPVRIRACPIVREPDGLALSSRNKFLDSSQRRHAPILYRALEELRQRVQTGERDAGRLKQLVIARIENTPGAVLDYVALVDSATLQPVERLHGDILAAVAVKFGATRLIDNIVLTRVG